VQHVCGWSEICLSATPLQESTTNQKKESKESGSVNLLQQDKPSSGGATSINDQLFWRMPVHSLL
jgi:hypothetical protein